MTSEHVWPQWLSEYAEQWGGRYIAIQRGTNRKAREFDAQVKKFCRKCNNGWMSNLEAAAKPILVRMMDPENLSVTLNRGERETVALWAYKTSLVGDLMNAETFLPPSTYHDFYKTRQLPPSAAVWAGGHQAKTHATSYWRHTSSLDPLDPSKGLGGGPPVTVRTLFCHTTLTVLRVAFQIFHHVEGDCVRYAPHDRLAAVLTPLWPNRPGMRRWPPRDVWLTDADLDFLVKAVAIDFAPGDARRLGSS